jgi:argonaute-like protein implicated in RNA metabolism and viral defense
MMITHAEQSKSNCEAARNYTVSQGKHLKVETTVTRTCKFYAKLVILMDSKTEQNMSHATSLLSESLKFKVHHKAVHKNDVEEQVFFVVKVLTLRQVTITFQGKVVKCQSTSKCRPIIPLVM